MRSRTAPQDGEAERIAGEAKDIVRRAAGDVAGLTVAAQIRQAARHLGFPADHWRPVECWYGRCASSAALVDLRARAAAWRQHETARAAAAQIPSGTGAPDHHGLARRLGAVRTALAELGREVDAIAADLARLDR